MPESVRTAIHDRSSLESRVLTHPLSLADALGRLMLSTLTRVGKPRIASLREPHPPTATVCPGIPCAGRRPRKPGRRSAKPERGRSDHRVDFRHRVLVVTKYCYRFEPSNGCRNESADSRRGTRKGTSAGRVPGRSFRGRRPAQGISGIRWSPEPRAQSPKPRVVRKPYGCGSSASRCARPRRTRKPMTSSVAGSPSRTASRSSSSPDAHWRQRV
jgi:hypothetical protein